MKSKMPRWLRHWEITRESWMWKFVARTSLSWGTIMFLLNISTNSPRRYSVLVTFCLWFLGGVMVAVFAWFMSERKYRRYLESERTS
ncbi:MAG TPA: hypothetical protein VJU77_01630 [Chthoniobacterales bacterium]|nr:hypothetical protein [Chthoniobacterales bacterium]